MRHCSTFVLGVGALMLATIQSGAQQRIPPVPSEPSLPSANEGPKAEPTKSPMPPALPLEKEADSTELACPAEFNDSPQTNGVTRLRLHGAEGTMTPAKVTRSVQAVFSEEARQTAAKKKLFRNFKGLSVVSLIIDDRGLPRSPCVKKPAGFGLDEEALKAVRQWRFEPATLNDRPVSVRIHIEVRFQAY